MLLNKHQPVRPRIHPELNYPLRYRTFPDIGRTRPIQFTDQRSMIAQARMYRFVRSGTMENGISIADMHDHLFYDQPKISKKLMGQLIVQTVTYNPRLLLGITKLNDRNRVIYRFNNLLEFQYGLEWMICTWLRKFLNDTAAPGERVVSGPNMMSEQLDQLANCPESEYIDVYEEMIWLFSMDEPDWRSITSGLVEEIPMQTERAVPIKQKGPIPKSLVPHSR